ncbi:sigma-70 family RNA polymerase sigma factor [Paenibacillus urinalis]|uniref:Sigma-70 family RNA polymerase sigma factor n=2 Tax=Paenibacillus TaxID=44249 RepID=A0AAX3MXT1_9BACL|nr:sigma-70 family RNA polymerase sigma factor [Paenibacillus urinalis]WDH82428.1 sigma-70 family RNA polymerase sigma factor [Paenibacillus urinalis]WDH98486.1 sigma-70 family RNA polymerase sigma factor [Paenibacillus urinalis]WDI02176.1 sigma-70 family RNA polymerase sigma factor [Paenibacillus urinalis]
MQKDSFTELFRMFQPSLYRYLYRMCGSKEVAEELLQETFYRAMLSLRLEDMRLARAWLYKVARNLFIDWVRKRKGEAEMLQAIEIHASGTSPMPTPEEALQLQEQRRKMTGVMRKLPEHYRTILYLREMEGSNYQVRVLSMPVYAGELKGDLKNIPHSTSNELHFVPHLTLRPFVKYQEEGNGMSWAGWLENADTLKQSVDQMLKDIEWLRQERSYRESENDGKRLDYLKENGVKVYGAVVTGPVRELEKLKQEQGLFYFQLGRIEIWNWEEHTS